MAIAIDATADGYINGSNLSYNHTVTGSDTALIVSIFGFSGTQPAVTAISYAGEPMTERGKILSDASGYTYQWGMAGANTGVNSISMTNSSSQVFATSASYTGVDQTTPFPDAAIASSSASASSHTISTTNITVDQSWVVMSIRTPSRVPNSSSDGIIRKLNTTSGDAGATVDSNAARSTGANTLNVGLSGAAICYYVISNLAPAGAAPAVSNQYYTMMGVGS